MPPPDIDNAGKRIVTMKREYRKKYLGGFAEAKPPDQSDLYSSLLSPRGKPQSYASAFAL